MDIARLDNLLLKLTDSERAYCAGTRYDWNDAFSSGHQQNIGEKHIHKIGDPTRALHQEGMPEGLSIVRNSRFNPVPEHVHNYVEISYVYRGMRRRSSTAHGSRLPKTRCSCSTRPVRMP